MNSGSPANDPLLRALPIATDDETPARTWRDVLALARAETLTTYDTAYLELALHMAAADRSFDASPQTA